MAQFEIGRYQVIDELAEGGMAVVFLAFDPYMKRQVAVKVLSYRLTSDELYHECFQREAEVIAALEHPCIVPIFDYGRHGVQPYFVMRFMAGGSLRDRLENGNLRLSDLSQIISRVAEGLDAAHAQGIVHRDVKPSNILFDASGEAFLADFGLARTQAWSTAETGSLFAGTPAYMSPEQVRGESLDGRSDVYALGVVLYHALTGCPPYHEASPMATARAHIISPTPSILATRPDLQPTWEEIIGQAMAKDPNERYPTAGELARDVREVISGRWYLRKLAYD